MVERCNKIKIKIVKINDQKWYRKEVAKLLAIVVEGKDIEPMIHRNYVEEKLRRILNEIPIGIHPILEPAAKKYYEDANFNIQ